MLNNKLETASNLATVNNQPAAPATDEINQPPPPASSLNEWMKLKDFLKRNPQFTDPQMRWLLLNRKSNGLDACIRKIGKPVYISEPKFLVWIEGYSSR